MKLASFEKSDAILTKQLDVVLKQMSVERQAYQIIHWCGCMYTLAAR